MKAEHEWVPVPEGGPDEEEGSVCGKDACVPCEGDHGILINCTAATAIAATSVEFLDEQLHRVVLLRHVT